MPGWLFPSSAFHSVLLLGFVDLVVDQWMQTHYLLGFVVVLLLLLILLGMRVSHSSPRRETPAEEMGAALAEVEEDQAPEFPPGHPSVASNDVVPRDSVSKSTASSKDTFPLEYVPTPADLASLERENPQKAAGLWARIGRWDRAAKLFAATGLEQDAAEAYLGLQQYDKAIPLLTKLFDQAPGDEKLRTELIEALMDTGQLSRAAELIQAVTFPDSPFPVSAQFLATMGRAYESLGDIDTACHYYQFSLQKNDRQTELPLRLQFLRQVQRLNQVPEEEGAGESPAREFLDRYLRDSSVRRLPAVEGAMGEAAKVDPGPPLPPGHEIIVGHLAFGFRKREPIHRVASVFSLARRFHIQRLLGQNNNSAVFEARDRVLDYPVALRLVRLPSDMDDFQTLKHRLASIASLNHPNMAKLTFVDRDGPMLRLATEFLPGGNLREFLTKLGGVGLPLLIKMAMHLASALHTAHLRGVPHGDIRPENILIGTDQRLKLIDFALSPIPVRRLDWEFANIHESSETPRLLELMARNEGVQSDILQFGEILEFMLNHARKTMDPVPNGGPSATDELRDLAKRVGKGEFSSVLRLWQVLEQVFQRTMPSGSAHEGSRSRG